MSKPPPPAPTASAIGPCPTVIKIVGRPGTGKLHSTIAPRGGRVVRRCWVIFQCRGVLLIWIIVGQGPIVLAVGAGGGCLDIFTLIYPYSFLSPSLWETARYRLKYCLKGPLSPKQPTNQPSHHPTNPENVLNSECSLKHYKVRHSKCLFQLFLTL